MIPPGGRSPEELRPVTIEPGYLLYAEGSALIKTGDTAVLCAVTVEDGVPMFARGTGSGWITAEYGMLPRSTLTRPPPAPAHPHRRPPLRDTAAHRPLPALRLPPGPPRRAHVRR